MGRYSGGFDPKHLCSECGHYTQAEGSVPIEYRCGLHCEITGEERIWHGNWMACRCFDERKKASKSRRKKR